MNWEGEPVESEEILPQWFNKQDLPLNSMWSDAKYWLPKVLQGMRLNAEFTFGKELTVEEVNIEEVAPPKTPR